MGECHLVAHPVGDHRVFFWFVVRAISRADRTERRVYKQIEDEERAKAGLPPKPQTPEQSPPAAEPDPAEGPPQ